ncbi:MAG: hypothetical protein QGG71_26245 [Pirellulaceae bacterium]|jgi:hypothetical protein|nr:hypothetical protein [Pirellulaceae bacterium]
MVKFFRVTSGLAMHFVLQPWQFFFVILVGWVHREQQEIIEFYQTQLDTVMKAQGKKRLPLTDNNVGRIDGEIQCRERLRGMLRYYYRDAVESVHSASRKTAITYATL